MARSRPQRTANARATACALAALTVVGFTPSTLSAAAGDPSRPGAYCPFPKQGEKPVCFEEVEREYPDFLAAISRGALDDREVAPVEHALRTAGSEEDRTLALSSLAYGYFMLAERAAASEQPDPALVAQLDRWNQLLGSVYRDAEAEPALRSAVREAALDLHARAPAVASACGSGSGDEACPTTSALLATLRSIDDPDRQTGVRGALEHLVGRVLEPASGAGGAQAAKDDASQ